MPKQSFEDKYPNIARWVYEHQGTIEIGNDPDSPLTSFVRAIDMGGMPWEGEDEYESLDDALLDLEAGLQECLREIYGEDD
ncbi:hypothetical protein IQ268_27765 [Oculatella sp. LEGE 06141]|uniref:hypothetical protein n=1 Tax=Oculatella sp. LEGE 06141 TaxID=1828648 RepID=UPI00188304BC|nr:hypothetical protein [Oculatella sp. LEGE 06141]MBE9182349.1 hypothetical protein [Oculatella sp. LEGE 06141]